MAQDPIGDLKKKRQREQQEKEISRYQDDAAYKSARERLSRLSAQSADHNRKQEYLKRPDTPLAETPEPKRK